MSAAFGFGRARHECDASSPKSASVATFQPSSSSLHPLLTDPVRDRLSTALSATHTIERELGGGGMARVFVATERALGRQVVIKTLPDDAWSPSAAQRFHREILTAAQLQHANIVPVLAAGDADGVPYFTMPLVEGATLRERMARGAVPIGEAIAILRDVARALVAAHAKNVVHRDIKPENILLSSGAALVSDFGVAKAVSLATQGAGSSASMTALGVAVGTPAYMAPEQIAADPGLDHRADLYAWGVVAYELLGGARPFTELSGTALIQAQMSTMPPALRTKSPSVPAPLADLVMRCLQKAPAARPQSASELIAVLDLPSGEREASVPRPTLRRGLFAVGAILVASAALWATLGQGSSADARTIAVAPFRVGGAAPEVRYLREGLGDLMVPQIQSIPERKAASMRVMLDRWRRAAGAAEEDLDDMRAAGVADDAGAGEFVIGEIVGTRDRLTVSARLLRTSDGRELAKASVDGTADEVSSLATRLLTSLLSLSDGATQERMRSVLSARSDAIAPYLLGEQLYRRGRYGDAGRAFLSAWTVDTTFAIAALRIGLTNGWTLDAPIPGAWNARAWAHRDRLTGPDSMLLIATVGETYPAPMNTPERFRSLQTLAERGNTAELWYAYGDFLLHNGGAVDQPRLNERALDAFRRAEALDSSYAPALEHQSLSELAAGDTAAAVLASARQARRDSTGDFLLVADFLLRSAIGTAADRMRELDQLEKSAPEQLGFAAGMVAGWWSPTVVPQIDLADSTLARARRHPGVVEPGTIAGAFARDLGWNSGRPDIAAGIPATEQDTLFIGEQVLAALVTDGDSMVARRGVATLERFARTASPTNTSPANVATHFTLGTWALARGDTAATERALRALREIRAPNDRAWLANAAIVFERILDAQLAVARRTPDAKQRLAAADSLIVVLPGLDRRAGRTIGNLILAGLWEQVGDQDRAFRALQRRDGQTGGSLFLADRERRLARVARALGRRDDEIASLRTFIALRERAIPSLQPEVAQARARLAELTSR